MANAPPPVAPRLSTTAGSTGAEASIASGRPLIGVTPSHDPGRKLRAGSDYWYLNRNYTRALAQAGAAPVVLCADTPIEACLAQCAGLVLSGGGDLPVSFAPEHDAGWQSDVPGEAESLERIRWERALLQAFAEQGRPVLGVCFGMQLMNLHFGGQLVIDLGKRSQRGLDHGGGGNSVPHALRVARDSRFFQGWTPPATVSSSHRQAVAQVAPGFVASAWAPDGVVEAIEREHLLGVEWHPESDASASFVYGRWLEQILKRR